MTYYHSEGFLIADKLAIDPRITLAKQQILQAVDTYRSEINRIRPPQKPLLESYEATLQLLTELRGIPLWHRYVGSGFGNGAFVELADGSVKYDFITGIGVHWGHCHPIIIEASIEAAFQDVVMQGNLQQNRDAIALMDLLVESSGLDHCILCSSGAMAVENGLKMLFQKKFPAHRLLAFERCFAGRTLYLSQITDKAAYREGLPTTVSVDYIPFYDATHPEQSIEKATTQLKKVISRYPKQHAGFCMELIQGEGGYYPGSKEFFKTLITILKENEIPVLIDEVQSFGRTDHLFAFQYFGLEEDVDVVSVGKILQTCATLYRSSMKPKTGLISQTFTSSTLAIRAGYAIVKSLLNDGYLGPKGKNNQLRHHFVNQLENLSKKYPGLLEGPFGCGLMIGMTPFKGEADKVIPFVHALFKEGVIGFIAGSHPMRVRFLVPGGAVTFQDIDEVVLIIEKTLMGS